MIVWGVADRSLAEAIELFLSHERAQEMLREVLADEPERAAELDVIAIKLEA